MHLDHLGRIGQHRRDGVARADSRAHQRRRQAAAALGGFAPGEAPLAVHDRRLVWPYRGRAVQERERRQRRVVGRVALEVLLVEVDAHRLQIPCRRDCVS